MKKRPGTTDQGLGTNYKEKSRRSLALFLFLVPGLWSLVPGPVSAKNLIPELESRAMPKWNPPKIIQKELPNGFRLYMLPDHTLPLFKAKVFIKVGSAYSEYNQAGLADLAATLLTTGGTQKKTPKEVDQWLDSLAIRLSSDADRELTTVTMTCLKSKKEEALNFLKEVLLEPAFDKERFELAKTQFKESLRRAKDQPQTLLGQNFREMIYGAKHPWGRHATMKTLRHIRREEVALFYQKYFHPNRMILAVAGDFSPQELENWFVKNFEALPRVEISEPKWEVLPFETSPQEKKIKKKLTQSFIEVGHLSLKRHDEEKYAYGLLQYVLGGDVFTSRLGKDIRTTLGLAYSVYAHWEGNPVRGFFKIHVETAAKNKEAVLERIRYHLKKLGADADMTEEELKLAKEALLNQHIFLFDSPFEVVENQAKLDLLGYPKDYLTQYPKKIKAVTLGQVKEVAKKYIRPEGLKIVIVGP